MDFTKISKNWDDFRDGKKLLCFIGKIKLGIKVVESRI